MLPRASTNNNSEKSSTPVPPTPSKDTKKAVIYVSGSHQKSEKLCHAGGWLDLARHSISRDFVSVAGHLHCSEAAEKILWIETIWHNIEQNKIKFTLLPFPTTRKQLVWSHPICKQLEGCFICWLKHGYLFPISHCRYRRYLCL